MKKLVLALVMCTLGVTGFSQKSIDELFDKYAGKEGFSTVTINGSILKFSGNEANIGEIRILSQEDKSIGVENFYQSVIKDLDLSLYEEFMRVKEAGQEMRMLVRKDGDTFKEFLLVSGGNDNAVIQIKGNMTLEEAQKFSGNARQNHTGDLF